MNYRIGLDIGISSIGFAVLETDLNGEPVKIKDLGVRIFEKAEQPKTGASLAEPRRLARGSRRRFRRKVHRRERTENLLQKYFGENITDKIKESKADVFELRFKGIKEILSAEELGKVLLYFVKHRGFLSNRKSDANDKEGGKLLLATTENTKYLNESGYRTVGEMIYNDKKYFTYVNGTKEYRVRNKRENYENTFLRSDLKNEILLILDKQKTDGKIDDEFIDGYLKIFWNNRNFDEGPGEPSQYRGGYAIGKCPFEKSEIRAPKYSFTFEYSNALIRINNLKITSNGTSRTLNEAEKELLIGEIKKRSEIKFSALKKLIEADAESTFNLLSYSPVKTAEDIEKKTNFVSLSNSYKIRKCLSEENATNVDVIDEIALVLSLYKSDDKRLCALNEIPSLSQEEKNALLSLNPKGFGGTSIKFLKNIQPYLEQGLKYDEACEKAGYNHSLRFSGAKSKFLDTKEVYERVQEISVPVVKRAVSQTIKVVNAIIRKYGSPMAINVELARELSKTYDERRRIEKENQTREKDNERIKAIIESEFGIHAPSGQDIVKYRLYEEQGHKSAYSLQPFDANKLFESDYAQIDHIVPYSKSFDDGFNNKVLVFSKENQDKKNNLPYEYFGNDEKRWTDFETFVVSQYKGNKGKRDRLLKKKFTEEDSKEWKERNLNDTKYISRFIYNLFKDSLVFAVEKKKNVYAVNGRITSYMRKMLGLNKDRAESDKHHAMDAAVIACITDGEIQKITQFNKGKERLLKTAGHYINTDGEIIDEKQYDEEFGKRIKPPYEGFVNELKFRLANDPKYYMDFFVQQGYSDEEIDSLRPVFVSRMVNKKSKGQIHDDTVMSTKIYDSLGNDSGKAIKKVPVSNLKLVKDKEGNYSIENYYRPEDDKLLYNKLLSLLIENGGNAQEAFKDPVYKPKSDGSNGARVYKVKVKEKITVGVKLDKIKGIAGNGAMLRIDVFGKNGKFYCVPVYVKDAYNGVLPNKAAVASRPYDKWVEIDDSFEFLFSLYKNDLVYVEHKSGLKLTKTNSDNKNDTVEFKKGFLYYNSFDISTVSAKLFTIDNGYKVSGAGITTLVKFKKCQADYFGNITFAGKEKRQGFNGVHQRFYRKRLQNKR